MLNFLCLAYLNKNELTFHQLNASDVKLQLEEMFSFHEQRQHCTLQIVSRKLAYRSLLFGRKKLITMATLVVVLGEGGAV